MAIKIFNTLTGKKEIFKPLKRGKVGIYVCGPTVYDEPHIGHLRSAYVFEVIRRYFISQAYRVKFVKNITDIDDKIIDKAREEFESPGTDLKEKVKEIAVRYINKYHEAMEAFGISSPDIEPRATDHIPDMIKLVEGLIEKDFAYQKEADVYFRVRKFPRYGRLSHQSIGDLQSGARIESTEKKFDPLDFALWKGAKENEPVWPTPWGDGRPGWHIECSCMSMKYLGRNFDIHGGGKDLVFPHHENEIAQSEAYTKKSFANYWLHNGLLTIKGEKMAKSLGNFISVDEILKRYHPEVLKIFFLSTHYRHPIDFSYEKMEEARRARERFYILLDKIEGQNQKSKIPPKARFACEARRARLARGGKNQKFCKELKGFCREFIEAMDDDFNTPRALAVLFDLVNFTYKNFLNKEITQDAKNLLLDLGKIFGLFETKDKSKKDTLVNNLIEAIIEIRKVLREKREFALADKIREDLGKIGIVLEDGPDKTTRRLKS